MSKLKTALTEYWPVEVLETEGNFQTYPSGNESWDTEYDSWNAFYDAALELVLITGTPDGYGLTSDEVIIDTRSNKPLQ